MRAGISQLVAILLLTIACTHQAEAQPVLLGGDDFTDHGSVSGGANQDGWLYIERAVDNLLTPGGIRRGNDGSIAALGCAASPATSANAGAAIGSVAAVLGKTVTYHEGATAINQFFADLAAGTARPALIWISGTGSVNNLDSSEGAAITSNASTLLAFVESGGALMAHGSGSTAYGWLPTVFPGITETAPWTSPNTLTAFGAAAFPSLTNADVNSGPSHSIFTGTLGSLSAVATDGAAANVLIGRVSFCPGSADTDLDAVGDACDNCPATANLAQIDTDDDGIGDACDGNTVDADGDGVDDAGDTCPAVFNPSQIDCDGDGTGDACDGDTVDSDGDGVDDSCDNCSSASNSGQEDLDRDGFGDVCDGCVGAGIDDVDSDGLCDLDDNCPDDANPGQENVNGDAFGDACQPQGQLDSAGCYAAFDTVAPPDGNEPTFSFNDISATGTSLGLSDDQVSAALPIGFDFEFYGTTYTQAYVSSNGFMTFLAGQSSGCCSGQAIPGSFNPNGLIAGRWTDLYPPGAGSLHYQTIGSAPARQFIVQFTSIPRCCGTSGQGTFQFVLNEGSNEILVQYANADGGSTSAGIENEAGSIGLQWAGPATVNLVNEAVLYSPTTDMTNDTDSDGVRNCLDNCPLQANPGQEDSNGNGVGDACDCGDGILATIETCDDGNANSGDGCDSSCQTESGYDCPTPGSPCTDLDECTLGTDNCDGNASCTNTPGSFTCACNPGYSGDGVTCTDDNECIGEGSGNDCDTNATCTNLPGSFSCACSSGWDGDGLTCTDLDECALEADNCDTNAACFNSPGSFLCVCDDGFVGNGVSCDLAHLLGYKIRAPRKDVGGADIDNKFPKGWVITVNDVHLSDSDADDPENFEVKKVKSLLNPAQKNIEPAPDLDGLHYLRYLMKSGKQSVAPAVGGDFVKPAKHVKRVWQLDNQFGTINVESKKVSALLLPANKDLTSSPTPPGDANHFVCYQVKATKDITEQTPESKPGSGKGKFRKDLQAFFEDQFEDCADDKDGNPSFPGSAAAGKCLFDLKKVKELCNPMDKTAVEVPRNTSATITASAATTPRSLLCYQPKLARKFTDAFIASALGVAVGDKLEPGQAKHSKRSVKTGNPVHTAPGNLFPNPVLVDTTKQELVCVPTDVIGVTSVAP